MALNIDVGIDQANKNVDALGTKIVALADKAEEAGKRASKALSFGTFAKDEIANIRKAMSDLNSIVKNFNDINGQTSRGLKKSTDDTGKYLKQVQELSKKLIEQNRALRDSQAALAAQTAKVNASTSATNANAAAQTRLNAALSGIGIGKANAAFTAGARGLAAYSIQSKLAGQTTAAMRGALQGAGAGMGIFTSNTIAAGAAAYGIAKALSATIKVGSEFEDTFNRAMALLGELGKSADMPGLSQQGRLIKQEIIDIATTSKFSAQETAEAVKELAQAGLTGGQVLAALRPILNTATVGMISVGDAAKITTNIIEQFGMSFNDVAKVGDVLAKGANISTIEVSDLARSLSYTGTIAHQTGISLNDTATAIALLGQAGIRGSKGGTALRDIIADLALAESGSGKAAKAIKKLGIEIVKDPVTGGLKLKETFENLNKALSNLAPAQRYSALLSIFGKIGATGAAALVTFAGSIEGASSKWDQFSEKINNAQGENERLAKIMNNNLATALKNLGGALETVAIVAEETFGPRLTDRIHSLIDYIKANRTELASNLAGIMNSLVTAVDFLVRNGPVIISILKTLLEYKALKFIFMEVALAVQFFSKASGAMAIAGQTVAMNSMSTAAALNMAAGGATAAAKSVGVAATGFSLLSGAGSLLLRVIGGIPGLLTLVGVGAYSAYSNMKDLQAQSEATTAAMKKGFQDVIDIESSFADVTSGNAKGFIEELKPSLDAMQTQLESLKKTRDELAKQPNKIVRIHGEIFDVDQQQGIDNLSKGIDGVSSKIGAMTTLIATLKSVQDQTYTDPAIQAWISDITVASGKVTEFANNWLGMISRVSGMNLDGLMTSFLNSVTDGLNQAKQKAEMLSIGPPANLAGPDPAKVLANQAAAATEAKSRLNELATELKSIIKDFGSTTGAIGDMNRQLANIDEMEKKLSGGKLAQKLADIGASADLARQALDWKREDVVLNTVSTVLGNLDPRFKDLSKTIKDTGKGTQDFGTMMALATTIVDKSKLSDEEKVAILSKLKQAIRDVADGSAEAAAKLDTFAKNTSAAFTAFLETDTVSGNVEKLTANISNLTDTQEKSATQAAQEAAVMKVLGSEYFKTLNASTQYNAAAEAAIGLEKIHIITGEQLTKVLKGIRDASPEGQVALDIEKLNGEMAALAGGGTRALEEYDAVWQATGGHIEGASAELKALIDQRQQLSEMKAAIENVFQGMEGFIRNVFDGAYHNAKDALSALKDLFKHFLIDLIMMAIKNKIMLNFGATGTGGGGGGTGGFIQGLMQIFGTASGAAGGGTVNGPTGGGGGAWYNTAVQGFQMLGMGQQAYNLFGALGSGSSAAGTANFSNVVGGVSSTAPTVAPVYGGTLGGFSTLGIGGALYGAAYGSTLGSGGLSTGIATGTGAVAGYGLGLGAATAMGAAGAGATAGGAAMAGLGAVPVVGWIALAALLIDKFSGGKLFGTKWRPEQSTVSTKISDSGADVAAYFLQSKQGSLFSGKKWKGETVDAGDEARKAATDFFEQLKASVQDAATKMGVEAAPLIDAEIQQIIQYTNKGKVKATSYLVDIIGRSWTEATAEAASARVEAEQIINAIDSGNASAKASDIAERWRDNAVKLLDGANMMVAAQADINSDKGLLGINTTLKDTVDIVEKLVKGNETLVDAYARIYAATGLLREAVTLMGVDLGKTGVEFVQFAADIADAAGGIENATSLWNTFFAAFYTPAEQSIYQFNQLKDSVTKNLKDIGLSADTSMEQFRTAFEKALPDLSPADIVKWLKAGDALAALFKLGDPAITFMQGIHSSLAQLVGGSSTDYTAALKAIDDQMVANIATAKLLGLSQRDLADIERLAALQTKQLIMSLKSDIKGIVTQLTGIDFDAVAQAQQHAVSTQQQLADESSRLSQAQLDAERERYNAAQAAIKQITDFLKSLQTGPLSSGSYLDQLNAAQSQYQDTLAGAQAGNPDDIANLTQAAQTYLQQAQGAYGNNGTYDMILQQVTQQLTAMQTVLAGFQNPPDQATVGSNGGQNTNVLNPIQVDPTTRMELAHELAQQIGALGLATGDDVFQLLEDNHYSLAQLAKDFGINLAKLDADSLTAIGDLAYLLGVPVVDLLTKLGVSAESIAAAANLDLSTINDNLIGQLVTLAGELGMSTLDLIDFLGIPLTSVADFFGVKLDDLTTKTVAGLVAMATALGVSSLDIIAALGINLVDLLGANGVDLSKLDANNFTNFVTLANSLHVSVMDLWTALGKNIADLGDLLVGAFTTGLSSLDNIPDDVMTGLQPFLDELTSATTPEEINQATHDIRDYIQGLPEAQRDILMPLFDSVFGANGVTGAIDDAASQAGNDAADQLVVLGDISSGTHNIDIRTMSIDNGINTTNDKLDEVNRNLRDISAGTQSVQGIQEQGAQGAQSFYDDSFDWSQAVTDTLQDIGASTMSQADSAAQTYTQSADRNSSSQQGAEAVYEQTNSVDAMHQTLAQTNERLAALTAVVASKLDRQVETTQAGNADLKQLRKTQRISTVPNRLKKS